MTVIYERRATNISTKYHAKMFRWIHGRSTVLVRHHCIWSCFQGGNWHVLHVLRFKTFIVMALLWGCHIWLCCVNLLKRCSGPKTYGCNSTYITHYAMAFKMSVRHLLMLSGEFIHLYVVHCYRFKSLHCRHHTCLVMYWFWCHENEKDPRNSNVFILW